MTAGVRVSLESHTRDVIAVAAVVAIAVAASWASWAGPIMWGQDSCFYYAQMLEVRGESSQAALAHVFATRSQVAHGSKAPTPNPGCVAAPSWVHFIAPNFRRRWVMPAAAAAVYPLLKARSLVTVALVGYLAAAVALYALARLRFSALPSGVAASLVTVIPQFRIRSVMPYTDAWGVALEALCLLIAILYLRAGRRLLALLWPVSVLLLAFTRDNAVVVGLTVAFVLLFLRSRRALLLAVTGVPAAAIPSLLFGLPLRVQLAYVLNNSYNSIPPSTSWAWNVHHYWGGIVRMLHAFVFPLRAGIIPNWTGLAMIVGLLALTFLWGRLDEFAIVILASIGASLIYVASLPGIYSLRIAFAFLPAVAAGYAAAVERIVRLSRSGLPGRVPRQALHRTPRPG